MEKSLETLVRQDLSIGKISKEATAWILPVLVLLILLTAVPRLQPLPLLQGRFFLENDAYRFVRQAEMILQREALPPIDDYRWYPPGARLYRWPVFYPYVLAAITGCLHKLGIRVRLYQIAIYYPLVAWILTLLLIYNLGRILWNRCAGLWAIFLLALWPITLQRTAVGFADMDALALFLITSFSLCLVCFFFSPDPSTRILWVVLGAFTLSSLVHTWAGAGLLLLALTLWFLPLYL